MYRDWKISTFNGVLLASYFIPAWAIPALKIVVSPVHGLFYERGNVGPAMFVSDILQFGTLATVRFAWLLALAKLTVVGFFAVFAAATLRAPSRKRGAGDEALAIALLLGSLVSVASMVLTSQVGDVAALRLHATESLLLLSLGIVMLVETDKPVQRAPAAEAAVPAADATSALAG